MSNKLISKMDMNFENIVTQLVQIAHKLAKKWHKLKLHRFVSKLAYSVFKYADYEYVYKFLKYFTELVRMARNVAQMLKAEITSNSFTTSTGTISDVLITEMNIHYAIIVTKVVQMHYKAVQMSRNQYSVLDGVKILNPLITTKRFLFIHSCQVFNIFDHCYLVLFCDFESKGFKKETLISEQKTEVENKDMRIRSQNTIQAFC